MSSLFGRTGFDAPTRHRRRSAVAAQRLAKITVNTIAQSQPDTRTGRIAWEGILAKNVFFEYASCVHQGTVDLPDPIHKPSPELNTLMLELDNGCDQRRHRDLVVAGNGVHQLPQAPVTEMTSSHPRATGQSSTNVF